MVITYSLQFYLSISLTWYDTIQRAFCFTQTQKSLPRLISKLWHCPFHTIWTANWFNLLAVLLADNLIRNFRFLIHTNSQSVKHSDTHMLTPQEAFPELSSCPPWQQTLREEERWYRDAANISSIVLIPSKNTKTMHQYRQSSSKERNYTTCTVTDKNIRKMKFWNGS